MGCHVDSRVALITSRRRPTPFERSRRPKMCYRTECGKCGKPTWVRDTRRAVAHHDSTARRAVPPVPARTTFFTHVFSSVTRDSPSSHARNRRTGWLRHARRAGAPRRSQGGSLRLPARFVVFLHDQLTREGARQGAPSTALRIGTHTKHVFPFTPQANDTSAPSSVARVGVHHAPNTQAPRLLGGRCRDSEARPQNPPSSGGGHGR